MMHLSLSPLPPWQQRNIGHQPMIAHGAAALSLLLRALSMGRTAVLFKRLGDRARAKGSWGHGPLLGCCPITAQGRKEILISKAKLPLMRCEQILTEETWIKHLGHLGHLGQFKK